MERTGVRKPLKAASAQRCAYKKHDLRFSFEMLLPNAALFIISALLGSYSPFEGVSPFGAASVMAAWYSGFDPYSACLGAAIGYLLNRQPVWTAASLALGACIFIISRKTELLKVYRLLAAFAAEAGALIILAPIARVRALPLIGSATVSVFAAVVMGHGFKAFESLPGSRAPGDTDLLTLSALAGLIELSMRSFTVLGQSPAMIFAGICSLFAAYRFGISGVAFAVTVGAGRILACGGDMNFIAVLAASTLFAASLRSLTKWAALAGFAAVSAVLRLILGTTWTLTWFELIVCCAVFALVPVRLYVPREVQSRISEPLKADSRFSRLQYRIASLSEVLNELSRVYGGEDGRMLERVAKTLRRSLSLSPGGPASFTAEYGVASAVKAGSRLSGDSSAIKDIEGKLLLSLSDGMGSGEAASNESRAALDLLLDLLLVGFDVAEAADEVNGLLTCRSSGDMYATLDVMLIDLNEGVAKLLKNGAPSSYVLRGGRLFTLYSEGLPVGIVDSAGMTCASVKLRSGDTVIMMTDGVADALGSDLAAAITDNVLSYGDVEMAAQFLLDEAKKHGHNDDMTVMLARIEQTAA